VANLMTCLNNSQLRFNNHQNYCMRPVLINIDDIVGNEITAGSANCVTTNTNQVLNKVRHVIMQSAATCLSVSTRAGPPSK